MVSLSDFGMNFDIKGFLNNFLTYLFIGVVLLIFIGIGYYLFKRKKSKVIIPTKKVGWWEEVNDNLVPTNMDDAKEILVPGTKLRLFYIKARDLWLPRFTKGITKDLFYVAITPKREMVNFTLRSIASDMKEAGLNYDHTDMIWASENLREFVKRNYRDKSIPWWKAYQGVITTAIYIVILTISAVTILYFMRGIVDDLSTVVNNIGEVVKQQANSCGVGGSGITPAV